MSNNPIFDVAGSALHAQSVRMNTIASNLANAANVAGDPGQVYKPLHPVFEANTFDGDPAAAGVRVTDVVESQSAPLKRYEPGNPLADKDGYVYAPDIDSVSQMVDMISAARGFQANIEVLNTAKELTVATLNLNVR